MFERLLESIGRRVELTPEEQSILCASMQVRRLRKRELLFREGEVCRENISSIPGAYVLMYSMQRAVSMYSSLPSKTGGSAI